MIGSAKKSLLLSCWPEEMEKFKMHLKKSEKEKVRISIIHFGPTALNTGIIFKHPIEDTIYSEKGGRGLVIVRDSIEVLVGTINPDNHVEGAVSMNNGFVTIAEDYIKHDIYIMKVVNRFNDLLIKTFGDNYNKLRDVFNDKEEPS
jgi:HTH-type transcriptional regulator, sugar sensing transcriptional regulator